MGFGKFGSLIEKHIGGIFHRRMTKKLMPEDVKIAIEDEIRERRRETANGAVVPNAFDVTMSVDDYQRLSSRRFIEDINMFIEREIIVTDSFMDGRLAVRVLESLNMDAGDCAVSSRYEDTFRGSGDDKAEGSTIVLERSSFDVPLNLPPVRRFALLRVIEGPDVENVLEFGERKIYIGRRDKNEMILTDSNASRLHAYIEYERHRHVIYDANSLNGTYIDGEKIDSMCLDDGDEITIGSSLLRYEVI